MSRQRCISAAVVMLLMVAAVAIVVPEGVAQAPGDDDSGCGSNPVCQFRDGAQDVLGASAAGGATSAVAGGAVEALASAVSEAVASALASVATLWVSVDTPNLTTTAGGSTPSDSVGFLQGSLWPYLAGFAVLAVIIGGARMAWEQRSEGGREMLKALIVLVVVSGAGLTFIAVAVSAADQFAEWIIAESVRGSDFGANVKDMLALDALGGLGPIIVIIFGLLALVASLVQIAIMVARGGMLVILAGILPLSAAATNTEMGRTWFKRCVAWLIAFILYKPAAAIVYAAAFRLAGSDINGTGDLRTALTGLVLMFLALLAMPALMRFVMPMVSSMSAGAGGGAMAGGAMAAMPSGAMAVSRGSSGGSSGSGSSGGSAQNGATGAQAAAAPSGATGASGAGQEGQSGDTPPGGATGSGGQEGGSGSEGQEGAGVEGGQGAEGAGAKGGGASGAAAVAGGAGAMAAGAAKVAKDGAQRATESQPGDDEGGPRGSG